MPMSIADLTLVHLGLSNGGNDQNKVGMPTGHTGSERKHALTATITTMTINSLAESSWNYRIRFRWVILPENVPK